MKEKIDQITGYIQERCLWQFFSRTWDREENIEGILTKTAKILCGEKPIVETPAEKSHYADAKVLASDIKRLFPWVLKLEKNEIKQLLQGVKEQMTQITVSGSLNEELNDPNY
jgi:vanadium nitrogenase delta subunit